MAAPDFPLHFHARPAAAKSFPPTPCSRHATNACRQSVPIVGRDIADNSQGERRSVIAGPGDSEDLRPEGRPVRRRQRNP